MKKFLICAATLNLLLFIGHLLCLGCLDKAFAVYGIQDKMNDLSGGNDAILYGVTILIAICFGLCGLWGYSKAGIIRQLPLLNLGIFAVAAVFLLRGVYGLYKLWLSFSWIELPSTVVALFVGIAYLLSLRQSGIIME